MKDSEWIEDENLPVCVGEPSEKQLKNIFWYENAKTIEVAKELNSKNLIFDPNFTGVNKTLKRKRKEEYESDNENGYEEIPVNRGNKVINLFIYSLPSTFSHGYYYLNKGQWVACYEEESLDRINLRKKVYKETWHVVEKKVHEVLSSLNERACKDIGICVLYIYVCVCVFLCVNVCKCVRKYVSMYVCIYVCMYE